MFFIINYHILYNAPLRKGAKLLPKNGTYILKGVKEMASIEKRGTNSWRLVVEAGYDSKGKRVKRTKTIRVEDQALLRTTKKLREFLETELHKFKIEIESGAYIAPEKMTFSAFAEEWREKYAIKNLGLKTLYVYESCLKNRILPAFGHLRLGEVKPIHVIDFLDLLGKNGKRKDGKDGTLSSSSIQYHYRVLKNIFSRAVEWKIIKHNPIADIQKPKVVYKVITPYDEQEVQLLFKFLQNEPYHWRMMVTLALTTGLRRGELLGLEWKHIDLENGIIDVVQSLSISLKGEIVLKEPKTKNAKRKVSLPSSVLVELKEYYQRRRKERLEMKDAWQGTYDFVFSHPDGQPFHHERPYLWFRRFIQKNDLRYIRFHDLRHTSATLLINQGVHAKIISERLGHGSITTTMNVYGHALRTADKTAAEKFEKILTVPNSSPNEHIPN
ncbi:site-specific integrase [Paenibacillus larvae]|nr:site-specific integrase [Paenibacillus larvae]MDR5566990.1 site-specific integrase [Paenibacillus larvae]MDR5595015.1 site-specific integrase [Paenibacillus larvae]